MMLIPKLSKHVTCPCGRFLGEVGWFPEVSARGDRVIFCNRALMPSESESVELGCHRLILVDSQGEISGSAQPHTEKYRRWQEAIARYNAGNPKAIEALHEAPITELRKVVHS
jgi:hypothetical protein